MKASGEFSSQKEKKQKKLSLNLSKNILLPPVNKICDKSGNGNAVQDSLLHTGTETPSLHTLLNECPALSCPLMIPHCPLAMSISRAGHQHPLCPAFTISGRQILIGAVSPSYPLHLMVFSTAPVSAPASFFPFFEKLLKRGVSIHWLSFLTSHSTLNPQQSDFNSQFPLPITISVDSRKTSMNSSILFRNLFF